MKTEFSRQLKIIAGVGGLVLAFTTLNEPAKSEAIDNGPAAVAVPAVDQTNAVPVQSDNAVIEKALPAGPPPDLKVSPALAQVIKLVQAGVNEDVILAYITNSPSPFTLTAEEILYMNDLGTPPQVLTTLVRSESSSSKVAPVAVSQRTETPAPPPATPAPAATGAVAAAPSEAATNAPAPVTTITYITSPATAPPSVEYFYDSLAPYGSWVDIAGYGWCWQPTVAVANVGWRPYCDRGRWVYSNCGWY